MKSKEDDSFEVEPEEQAPDESNNTDLRRSLYQIITQAWHSVHTPSTILFPSTFKNPKSANFWVKIFIPNHCKSSGSKFLRSSSIKHQVLYHLNSSHFVGFCAWFVCFS